MSEIVKLSFIISVYTINLSIGSPKTGKYRKLHYVVRQTRGIRIFKVTQVDLTHFAR